MAGIAEKLYPPVIPGSIPAFYSSNINGTAAIIAVPFSMNKAVGYDDIDGFKLKIKTVQSNTYLTTLTAVKNSDDFANRVVKFNWPNPQSSADESFKKIKIGQFLKVQMAYYQGSIENPVIGYYSTVGVVKYTSQPTISLIFNQENYEQNSILPFQEIYYGKYEPGLDKSERPYSYIFSLYDRWGTLIETSGWKLHNSKLEMSEINDLNTTNDFYSFETTLIKNQKYKIQYGVKTINNLEIYTPMYECMDVDVGIIDLNTTLYAENVFDDGYIKIYFDENNFDYTDSNKPISIEVSRAEKTDGYSSWKIIKKAYFSNIYKVFQWSFKDFTIEQGMYYKYAFRQYDANGNHTTLCIAKNVHTGNEEIFADFEDMFLWDGERQLKIRFNPKVTSFKTTLLESKVDTIGSRYPFIFRNGSVAYKEFPISGLISYLMDDNSLFLNHIDDLDIYMSDSLVRDSSPSQETKYLQTATLNLVGYNILAERKFKIKLLDWLNNGKIKLFRSPAEGNYLVRLMNISLSPEDKLNRMLHTFSATAYEMEEFSYKNLSELGLIKMDEIEEEKIYTESVPLVRVIRHEFEKIQNGESVKINNYNIINLLSIKTTSGNHFPNFYVRLGEDSPDAKTIILTREFILQAKNKEFPDVYFNATDNISGYNNTIKQVINYILDNLDVLQEKISFYWKDLLIFSDYSLEQLENISQNEQNEAINVSCLRIKTKCEQLLNQFEVYIDEFLKIFSNELKYASSRQISTYFINKIKPIFWQDMIDLVGDALLTYQYKSSEILTGELINNGKIIDNIAIKNVIETIVGPVDKSFYYEDNEKDEGLLQFFVLNFRRKIEMPVPSEGSYLDKSCLYYTENNGEKQYYMLKENQENSGLQPIEIDEISDNTISLIDEVGLTYNFNTIPIISLTDRLYKEIHLGAFYCADCAYQVKIINYKNNNE